MNVANFLLIEFVVLLVIFAVVIVRSGIEMSKEDKERAAYRADLTVWYEQKRKEREQWQAQQEAARKLRMAA